MYKFKLFLTLLLASSPLILNAQNKELKVELHAGHYTAFGGYAAASIETARTFCENFSTHGGLQYNTIGKTSTEIRPAYHIPFKWGKLSIEAILAYTHLRAINSFAARGGTSLDSKSISTRLGYYYRLYGSQGDTIKEAFNIYYELRAHFLQKIEDWNLDLIITNCETFELERHFQPSFIAEGSFFTNSNLGISLGVGCKPSGMFNMSADYYQSYLKTGICYRW